MYMCKLLGAHKEITIQVGLEMAHMTEFLWLSMSCKILNTSVGMEKGPCLLTAFENVTWRPRTGAT